MCGLAGLATTSAVGDRARRALIDAHRHRGPDDDGTLRWTDETGTEVLLAHRRLAVIELSDAGHQPMESHDGRYSMVFNGEIYNHVELDRELAQLGSRSTSGSDTEVLVRAWAAWGPSCLDRLQGMFAFAVLDRERRELMLVRDQFGVKPLYYAWTGRGIVFASELPTILDSGLVERRIDDQTMFDYLRWGLVDHRDRTFVAGIRHLPAAHHLTIDLTSLRPVEPVRYWAPPERHATTSGADPATELRDRFLSAVEQQMRSDVPVGSALSGGVDSSAIVAAMRHVAGPSAEIHAFGYVSDDPRTNELRWMRMAAEASGARLHEVRVAPTDLLRDVDALIRTQGEPVASTSMYAQRRVFAAARDEGIVVLLDGQGADELFGGYRRYLAGHLAGLVGAKRWADAARLIAGTARRSDVRLDRRTVGRVAAMVAPPSLRPAAQRVGGRRGAPGWLSAPEVARRGVDLGRDGDVGGLADSLEQALLSTSLPSLLRYEDRNSMAHSLESRVPFLHQDLAEHVLALPAELLVSTDGTTKAVFREAMRGVVPDPILDRRDKIGFEAPAATWLEPLSDRLGAMLRGSEALRVPLIDRRRALLEWERDRAGAVPGDWRSWRWFNALQWADTFDVASAAS